MKKKVAAIVLAAGQGKRMNTSVAKQFLMLNEKPVIYYSLKTFEESSVDEILLVTGRDMLEYCQKEIVERYNFSKVSKVVEGGKERYDSVYQALLHTEADYVLIHDGARPFITIELIEDIINQVKVLKACLVGAPVKETIKIVDENGYITATPDRNSVWTAQTPQAFEYNAILKAYNNFYEVKDKLTLTITDDAMVYETFLQEPVKMLQGDYKNIKLTTPEDLILAEQILMSLLCE
jgi:2-C-methyl-D-erythritol 4-phosphate cytidylyltransferase